MKNTGTFIIVKNTIDFLRESHIVLPHDCIFEIYHHYGIENFENVGTVFIKVINREYCKSYAVLLPKQSYPAHFHKIKKESFYVLYGDLTVKKEGSICKMLPGEILNVERLEEHSFTSEYGCVFEEISTTYLRNDSIYSDKQIHEKYYNKRKTIVKLKEWKEIYKDETGEEFFY